MMKFLVLLGILLLELLLVEARASGLDGQYIKAKFNKNGRYKVDSNEGKYVHMDDKRHLGKYVHVHIPYNGGYGPFEHAYAHIDNAYKHLSVDYIPNDPFAASEYFIPKPKVYREYGAPLFGPFEVTKTTT